MVSLRSSLARFSGFTAWYKGEVASSSRLSAGQRCACGGVVDGGGECARCRAVREAVAAPARPLGAPERARLQPLMGADLGQVRIHTDAAADRAAAALGAEAFTVGRHVGFASGRYAPETDPGLRLLAHEIAHTRQTRADGVPSEVAAADHPGEREASGAADRVIQGRRVPAARVAAPAGTVFLQKKPGGGGKKAAPKKDVPKPKTKQSPPTAKSKKCGRDSQEHPGFDTTHIGQITVNLDNQSNGLRLTWEPAGTKAPSGPFPFTPGAGLCCNDCDNKDVSQTKDTLCTPKGGPFKVFNASKCHLDDHEDATNPTYFQRAGIAIHTGNLFDVPRSHGCVRTTKEASALIQDNVKVGKTEVVVTGTFKSAKCWDGPRKKDPLLERAKVCDGSKRKPKKPEKDDTKGKKKATGKAKQTFLDRTPSGELVAIAPGGDGPGPG